MKELGFQIGCFLQPLFSAGDMDATRERQDAEADWWSKAPS